MLEDNDIKIAGSHPFQGANNNAETAMSSEEFTVERLNGNIFKARKLGEELADEFCKSSETLLTDKQKKKANLIAQRSILLMFAATVALEAYCPTSVASHVAQDSFYQKLSENDPYIYKNATDSGAFSFYYLAFRRGGEIERNIGQTFAMLCAHDGDPVYQELGEALYCWFYSVCEKSSKKVGFAIKEL